MIQKNFPEKNVHHPNHSDGTITIRAKKGDVPKF